MSAQLEALIKQQALERAALVKSLDETRDARAAQMTRAELDQPVPAPPPGMASVQKTQEEVQKRHVHNLTIADKKQIADLDQRHATVLKSEELSDQVDTYGQEREADAVRRNPYPKPPAPPKQAIAEAPTVEVTQQHEAERIRHAPPQTLKAEEAHERVIERNLAAGHELRRNTYPKPPAPPKQPPFQEVQAELTKPKER